MDKKIIISSMNPESDSMEISNDEKKALRKEARVYIVENNVYYSNSSVVFVSLDLDKALEFAKSFSPYYTSDYVTLYSYLLDKYSTYDVEGEELRESDYDFHCVRVFWKRVYQNEV